MYDPTLSFPREKLWSGIFHLLILCWPGVGTMMNDCVLKQTACFVFSVPQVSPSPSAFWHRWNRSYYSGQSSANLECWATTVQLLPYLERNSKLEGSFWSYDTMPGAGIMVKGYLEFFYQHWCGSFHGYPGYKSLLSSCWTSHKRNLFMCYCWVSVSIGRRRIHYFLFHLLAGITSSAF